MYFVEYIEKTLWIDAKKKFVDMLPWEPAVTSVNSDETTRILWWKANIQIESAIEEFVDWYKWYKNI